MLNATYSPHAAAYAPHAAAYPPQAAGYPSQQATGYPPQATGYPPQATGYPPQATGYPPQATVYPPQVTVYPPQATGYPPQDTGYPPQDTGYPSQATGYPSQATGYPPPQAGFQQPYSPKPGEYDVFAGSTNVYGKPLSDSSTGMGLNGQPFGPSSPNYDGKDLFNHDISTIIRHAFIRKVYTILSIQFIYTFSFGLVFSLYTPARIFMVKFWWVPVIFTVIGFVLIIVISCCPHIGRQVPTNFILLAAITVCQAWMIGLAGALTSSNAFAIAIGIVAVVCIALTIFAVQTKWDFTGCSTFIFIGLVILILFGILSAILRHQITHIVYASLGALFLSFVLVYDTQQIVGGKHRKYQCSIDDYIFGALTLYLDINNLFFFILSLTSAATD